MPTSESFQVVFDIGQAGYRYWWFAAVGVLIAGLGVIGVIRGHRQFKSVWGGWVAVTFGFFWTVTVFVWTYSDYRSLIDALHAKRFSVIEGSIQDFIPGDGRTPESFWVDGRHYSYSWSVVEAGYNGGFPLHSGMSVRILDVDGHIARLEVRP
jgi:hypothetical protein